MEDLRQKVHSVTYIDGASTIRQFLRDGQIQELRLTRVPILLGISLFDGLGKQVNLEHVNTKQYTNGLVTTHSSLLRCY
jgi:dihydrofolate reductase